MAPELNQMSFRKIKELILEVVNMVDNTIFISVKDIMKTLSVSESKAYSVVRQLNKELTEQGYMVIEYSCAVKPHVRSDGNRQSGTRKPLSASLLA